MNETLGFSFKYTIFLTFVYLTFPEKKRVFKFFFCLLYVHTLLWETVIVLLHSLTLFIVLYTTFLLRVFLACFVIICQGGFSMQ